MNQFDRALDFTLAWEGGYSDHPGDSGNWTGGSINSGELKGTKWGISAAAYPLLDIKNLTLEEAREIYYRDYWLKLKLPEDVSVAAAVAVFDAAVNHGVGRAGGWWVACGYDVDAFMVRRMDFFTGLGAFNTFGRGWMRRMADLYRLLNELRHTGEPHRVRAERFFLIAAGITVRLPLAAASVVGDKLYVRLGRREG